MEFELLDRKELEAHRSRKEERYQKFCSQNLKLDMTRGKPCPDQLNISNDMLNCVDSEDYLTVDGTDCRNYGGLDGIPEAKRLFSEYMGVTPEEIVIGGNSSLKMMYDTIVMGMLSGMHNSKTPWSQLPKTKFLCPCPGYDRHFAVCEHLNIEMIPIELNDEGPDMDTVERLLEKDPSIKGMWCVPKFSNPTGIIYSDLVVDRLVSMNSRAKDFRIFWDNAYSVHQLNNSNSRLKDIIALSKESSDPDRIIAFGSTSKISFAGAGIAMLASSQKNIEFIKNQMFFQTIGPDKLNQLRHVLYFKNMDGIKKHMKTHAEILRPKFDLVQKILEKELSGENIAEWSQPNGGYFVSLNTMEHCAEKVIKLAAEAGVKLTPAGATFPYGKDPRDQNIRIAPSFPSLKDIRVAMELLTVCIQLVSIDKILKKK